MIRFLTPALLLALGINGFAADYAIDGVHSSAAFKIKHLLISNVSGHFNKVEGVISYDVANPTANKVAVTIAADSVDTSNEKRDSHLKGPDFFEVAKYPTLSFTSTSWKPTGTDTFEVAGTFTLHGVSKPITVTVTKTGEGKGFQGESRIGFETAFTIKRSDYGMTGYSAAVGDDVKIEFTTEAVGK
jgi:polyisoprenoid-binding protein YceI